MRIKSNIGRIVIVLSVIAAILVLWAGWYLYDLARFPVSAKETIYQFEIVNEGIESHFRNEIIYRQEDMVPLLEVTGDHAEMGLQYGVLLKPEIKNALHSYKRILQWHASREGIPFPILVAYTKYRARGMACKLPERFNSEIKKIANGAGISYDVVLMAALFYDISEAIDACSDVLMRGKNGTSIHGRNNDTTFIGGYGTMWSDQKTGEGLIAELVTDKWQIRPFEEPITWNFNWVSSPELRKYQSPAVNLFGTAMFREQLAMMYPVPDQLEVQNAIDFLRLHKDNTGLDYTKTGSLWLFSNFGTQQMIVFDPGGDGFYMSVGESMASRNAVHRIFEDFSRAPELFMESIIPDAFIQDFAKVRNSLLTNQETLEYMIDLTETWPNEEFLSFQISKYTFDQEQSGLFYDYAIKALNQNDEFPEYRLWAAFAEYRKGHHDSALQLAEPLLHENLMNPGNRL